MKLSVKDIKSIEIKGRTYVDEFNPYRAVRVIITLEPVKVNGERVMENKIILTTEMTYGDATKGGVSDTACRLICDTFNLNPYVFTMSRAWKKSSVSVRSYPTINCDFKEL